MAGKDDTLAKMSNVKAHELREIATSWAAFSGVSTKDIMRAVFWRGNSTFVSYYLRDMAEHEEDIYSLSTLVVASSVVTATERQSSK